MSAISVGARFQRSSALVKYGAGDVTIFRKEFLMGAKNDLNEIYLTGSVVLAAFLGAVAQSWGVFFVILALAIGIAVYSKKIR